MSRNFCVYLNILFFVYLFVCFLLFKFSDKTLTENRNFKRSEGFK